MERQPRAAYLVRYGKAEQAFEWRSLTLPVLQADEVLIETEAFGLNFADVLARNGLYREAPPLPAVIGYDLVGKITAVGNQVDQKWLGKRVAALTRFGAYATHAITKTTGIVEVPDDMPAGDACALGTQYATAYYSAFYVQQLHEGENVLIHAASGGVGTALLQLALNAKCKVFATVGSDEKKQDLINKGIAAINYNREDYEQVIKTALNGDKLDVSFNSIAGSTFKKDMRLLGANGRLVLFGFAERSGKRGGKWATLQLLWNMGIVIPIMTLAKSKSIIGVNMLKIGDHRAHIIGKCMESLMDLYKAKKIQPIIGAEYKENQLGEAHAALENRMIKGKAIVYLNP